MPDEILFLKSLAVTIAMLGFFLPFLGIEHLISRIRRKLSWYDGIKSHHRLVT